MRVEAKRTGAERGPGAVGNGGSGRVLCVRVDGVHAVYDTVGRRGRRAFRSVQRGSWSGECMSRIRRWRGSSETRCSELEEAGEQWCMGGGMWEWHCHAIDGMVEGEGAGRAW